MGVTRRTRLAPRVLSGNGTCDHLMLSAVTFVQENDRRVVSSRDGDRAIPGPRHELAHSTIDARLRHEPRSEWALDRDLSPPLFAARDTVFRRASENGIRASSSRSNCYEDSAGRRWIIAFARGG